MFCLWSPRFPLTPRVCFFDAVPSYPGCTAQERKIADSGPISSKGFNSIVHDDASSVGSSIAHQQTHRTPVCANEGRTLLCTFSERREFGRSKLYFGPYFRDSWINAYRRITTGLSRVGQRLDLICTEPHSLPPYLTHLGFPPLGHLVHLPESCFVRCCTQSSTMRPRSNGRSSVMCDEKKLQAIRSGRIFHYACVINEMALITRLHKNRVRGRSSCKSCDQRKLGNDRLGVNSTWSERSNT